MTITLSEDQLREYDRRGIVFPIEVLSTAEVSLFLRELQTIVEHCGGTQKRLDGLHLFFEWAYRLVSHERLLNVIEDVLGGELLVDGSLVFYKRPHDLSYVSWHQDSVYSDWHQTPSTSAWIALTPSHAVNGCMRVIPGSHKHGQMAHNTVHDGMNLLVRGEQIITVDDSRAVDVVLSPGQMSLHQSDLVHGSRANTSDEPRIGFIVRFVTHRVLKRDRPLLRVRGSASCGHLRLGTPPTRQNDESVFLAWRRANS